MKRLRDAPDLLKQEVEEATQDVTGLAKSLSQLLTSKADKKAVSDVRATAEKLAASINSVLSQIRGIEQSLRDNHAKSGEEANAVKAKVENLLGQVQTANGLMASIETLKQRITQVENNDIDVQFSGVAKEANDLKTSLKKLEEAVKSLNERPQTIVAGGGISASGTPATNEYARFTKRHNLEGRTAAQVKSDLDLEAGTDFPSLTTFNDHSARHEDAGADEISLAGLAGTPAALTTHEGAADPHTGYVLESADAAAAVAAVAAAGVNFAAGKTVEFTTPSGSRTASGIIVTETAGASLVFGNACYRGIDGKMEKALADDAAITIPATHFCLATIAENATGLFLKYGEVYSTEDSWAFDTGLSVYLSAATAGLITKTMPTKVTGNQVQVLGTAKAADKIEWIPSMIVAEYA